ncbi:MAG TPA: M14 family zinc carboxypeptidase [Longimicrobiales bacterium]|nr:M14 family zinc carboxypeptidase [Longimicrobiales bacterium]
MPYPTVSGYETEMQAIANAHPTVCSRFIINAPAGRTHEGRDIFALRIGPPPPFDPPSALVIAGMHAREWAPPDALLTFARRLLDAYAASGPLRLRPFTDRTAAPPIVYPEVVLPWPTVRAIVDNLNTIIVPMSNPDGRIHSHTVKFWRKNRRPGAGTCPPPPSNFPAELAGTEGPIGVDPNRNFDITWDFEEYYSPVGAGAAGVSKDRCDLRQTYIGPSAASEPETRAIQKLIDDNKVRWFMDVHAHSRLVLHPWSMETNGGDSTQTFQNTDWNRSGARGGRDGPGPAYMEFVPDAAPTKLLTNLDTYAKAIRDAVLRCGGQAPAADRRAIARSTYRVGQPLTLLYGVTGGSMDYAFSRQFLPGGWGPIYAFALECGSDKDGEGGFHPSTRIYPKIEREVHAAVFALLEIAANAARRATPAPATPATPAPSTGPPRTSGDDTSCPFTVVSLGTLLEPYLARIRHLRDEVLPHAAFGRIVARAASRVYRAFGPPIVPLLRASRAARLIARTLIVAPVMLAILLCGRATARVHTPARRAGILAGLLAITAASSVALAAAVGRMFWRAVGGG